MTDSLTQLAQAVRRLSFRFSRFRSVLQRRQKPASSPESTSPASAWTSSSTGARAIPGRSRPRRRGYRTPTGTFRPQALAVWHRSTIYSGSPMPHSIFFHGGYAIHGSYETKYLGRPASHGCVRLHPSNAAALYSLVRKYGSGNTVIKITY